MEYFRNSSTSLHILQEVFCVVLTSGLCIVSICEILFGLIAQNGQKLTTIRVTSRLPSYWYTEAMFSSGEAKRDRLRSHFLHLILQFYLFFSLLPPRLSILHRHSISPYLKLVLQLVLVEPSRYIWNSQLVTMNYTFCWNLLWWCCREAPSNRSKVEWTRQVSLETTWG